MALQLKWLNINVKSNFYVINLNQISRTIFDVAFFFRCCCSAQVLIKHKHWAHHILLSLFLLAAAFGDIRIWNHQSNAIGLHFRRKATIQHKIWKMVYDFRLQAITWTNRQTTNERTRTTPKSCNGILFSQLQFKVSIINGSRNSGIRSESAAWIYRLFVFRIKHGIGVILCTITWSKQIWWNHIRFSLCSLSLSLHRFRMMWTSHYLVGIGTLHGQWHKMQTFHTSSSAIIFVLYYYLFTLAVSMPKIRNRLIPLADWMLSIKYLTYFPFNDWNSKRALV